MGLTLVVLAAGMGSRYGGLKQMDGFGPHGETILAYSIYDALQAGFDHVVFVIRRSFADMFIERVGKPLEHHVRVSYVFQEIDTYVPDAYIGLVASREKPWGTAHAMLVAKDHITTPFAVINADDFYGRDAYVQIANFLHKSDDTQIGMVGYVLKNTLSPFGSINRGVCEVEDGHLVHVVEHLKIAGQDDGRLYDMEGKELSPTSIVSMNFWGFHPSCFSVFEEQFHTFLERGQGAGEFFIPLVVDHQISSGAAHCQVMMSHESRCGVSYQEDKPFVQQNIAALHDAGVYPEQLFPA